MGRPTTTGTPNLTCDDGLYRWRNPTTGKRTSLGRDRAAAVAKAERANLALAALAAARAAPDRNTIAFGIGMYAENVVPRKPWDTGTRRNAEHKLAVLKREMGTRLIAATDRVFLADWLDARARSGDVFNKWRAVLVDLWRYWIERKWCDFNEAAAVMARSTSQKLPENRRQRRRLELAGFWAIHDHETCPVWLQVAMEQSLVTLQARKEICAMRVTDYRDGFLYVVRDKTAGDSDMAFIRIEVTEQLDDIRRRAMADGVATPHLVHRRPARIKPHDRAKKPHWAAVAPPYLTKAFQAVRDATGLWDSLKPEQRPTFHEIRSLGAREYRKRGYPKEYIQALMTHADPATTTIYLSGGADALAPDHYRRVQAGLRLEDLRK